MPLEAFVVPLQRVAVAKMVRQLSEVYSVMRVSTMSELAPFIGFGQVGGAAAASWRRRRARWRVCARPGATRGGPPANTPVPPPGLVPGTLRRWPVCRGWRAGRPVPRSRTRAPPCASLSAAAHAVRCPPAPQAEQQIVDAVRNGYFQARFDHKNNTVHFGGQVGVWCVGGRVGGYGWMGGGGAAQGGWVLPIVAAKGRTGWAGASRLAIGAASHPAGRSHTPRGSPPIWLTPHHAPSHPTAFAAAPPRPTMRPHSPPAPPRLPRPCRRRWSRSACAATSPPWPSASPAPWP